MVEGAPVSLCTIGAVPWSRCHRTVCHDAANAGPKANALFEENGLEHGRERAGARAPLAREAGLPIADLTASNPTRCGFAYPLHCSMRSPIRARSTTIRSRRACCAAREAVCEYYADPRRRRSNPSQIVLTTSTSEAYSFLFRLLCDPGGEILAPQPGYPLFDFLAVLDDVR